MAAPEDNAEHAGGKLGGYGVGIAMIAIFVGMALVVAFAASDGAIFGQNFQSAPSEDVPVSDSGAGDAVALSRDTFNEGPGADSSSAIAPPPEDGATLSEEERRLLAMKDFPWDSVAGGHIASNQDAFQRFGQQSVAQRPVEPGTEPLSLSDQVVVDVDRRDRVDRDRDDSDRDTLPAGIIEIDVLIGNDDEDQQEEVDEQPDDTLEDDQEGEPQNDDAENDQEGSDEETDDDSSGEDSGEGNSGSGSDDDQSGEAGDGGDSSGGNSTGTSGPSEDSGSESDTGDGNSTGIEVTVSLG